MTSKGRQSAIDRIAPPLSFDTPRGVMDVISGGSIAAISNKQKKAFIRAVHHVSGQPKSALTNAITITDDDYPTGMVTAHDNAPVIIAQVGSIDLWHMLVDNESSVDILYGYANNRLDLGGS